MSHTQFQDFAKLKASKARMFSRTPVAFQNDPNSDDSLLPAADELTECSENAPRRESEYRQGKTRIGRIELINSTGNLPND